MFHGTFKIHVKYLNENVTSGLNILLKHFKHLDHTLATMQQNLPADHHGRRLELIHRPAWGKLRGVGM
jgi:hypothetical protein